jgi:hypothetical protein
LEITEEAGEMTGKFASASCGLQTSARNMSDTIIEIETLLTAWIEYCNQKGNPLS